VGAERFNRRSWTLERSGFRRTWVRLEENEEGEPDLRLDGGESLFARNLRKRSKKEERRGATERATKKESSVSPYLQVDYKAISAPFKALVVGSSPPNPISIPFFAVSPSLLWTTDPGGRSVFNCRVFG